MQQPTGIAYACINAIGNSLRLEEMLGEVIETFLTHSGACGGKYVLTLPSRHCIVEIGEAFDLPLPLTTRIDGYAVHPMPHKRFVLDIPIGNEHFLFLFTDDAKLAYLGAMFSDFRIKLSNAIDACRNEKRLNELNSAFQNQVYRNEANEKLMISQSRMAIMGEMIGMIAHQWRQPITIIGLVTSNSIINTQLGELHEEQLLHDLELIDKQVHFLSRTIDDFRNFFRPNKLPQRITYGELSDELGAILGKCLESQRISLSFRGERTIAFTTYKNEMLQVFLNILNNAKDAFDERKTNNPSITFEIEQREGKILFLVTDNAGGIPLPIIQKIFEPYFSTKDEKHGTGLGLYMSAIITEKHLNGSIRVCSDDNTTVFAVLIPDTFDKETFLVY